MKYLSILFFSFSLLFCSCKENEWEYKTVQVDGIPATTLYGDAYTSYDIMPTNTLNEIAAEGWELVTAYPITETVHPNFGDDKYVTGLQPNTRTKAVQFIFKRVKQEKSKQEKENVN